MRLRGSVKTWGLVVIATGGFAWLLWPNQHNATATPEAGLDITLSIRPMQSIHSDWHRKVTVSYEGKQITQDLVADTGWWRGSHLYRHVSGAYLLHEGQAGCVGFTLAPLAFDAALAAACNRAQPPANVVDGHSLYYTDLIYLGHFLETSRDPDGVRLKFSHPAQTPEWKLPDVL